MKDLASKIENASTGELADLNNQKLNEILDTLIDEVEDPDTRMDLESAHHLLAVEGVADDEPGTSLDRSMFSDEVAAAMAEGTHPEDTEFAEFFPPSYTEMKDLEREIAELETEREAAHNWQVNPWDNDDDALVEIDSQLAEKRAEREELRQGLGADKNGELSEVGAVAAVADVSGDREWEGQQYAQWIVGQSPNAEAHDDDYADDMEFVSEQVSDEPDTAVTFFNELGPEGTAGLPAQAYPFPGIPGKGDQERYHRTLENFSVGLGEASKQRDQDGNRRLEFTGDKVISVDTGRDDLPLILGQPEDLFITGDFDQEFLVDATTESLRQGDEPKDHRTGPTDDHLIKEDPRNIMLDRVSESPETAAAVVTALDESGEVDLLLSPDIPYLPTSEKFKYPPADDNKYPITTFLNIAGADDDAARIILFEAGEDPEPFSDPGVAGGVDDIMARHATIMYDEDDLDTIGVEKTSLNDGVDEDDQVDNTEWQNAHEKVLEHGEGRRLQAKTEEYYLESVAVAVEDGVLDRELVEPFGVVYGAVKTETDEAAISYYADLDDDARNQNKQAALASSFVFSILPIDDDLIAQGIWAGEEALGLADPFKVPDDAEIEALRDQRTQGVTVDEHRSTLLKNVVYRRQIEKAVEDGTISINIDGEIREVPIIQRDDGTHRIRYFDGDQGEFVEAKLPPRATGDEYHERFDGTDVNVNVSQAPNANDSYLDGVIASVDDRDDLVERRAEANVDQGIEGTPEQNSDEAVTEAEGKAGDHGVPEWVADGPEPKEDDGWWPF